LKTNKYLQIRVVQSKDPDQFQREFNEVQIELQSQKPETKFDISSDYYKAIIQYEVTKEEPETAQEEMAAQGLYFTCENCPKFEPERNNDGTVRQTAKRGGCFLNSYTRRDSSACEWFCRQLLKGEIKVNKEGLK